ncbi:hypothetical protein J1N35_001246 [Gossypium stocksii]|uniref:Putative plant transposon protein domain-containing protein n=1 Tax=Gossypium stocksii TaxID=47602 RepID=A0A9D3WK23_9ROSI|nr:hypothetical protein J1N35_001246 [Gossypium stocksii]
MHLEKGFTQKESNYIDFMARIRQVAETLNWELFYEKRPSVNEELVCEFYANLISSELTEVPVRGIKVPITSNAINEFFELPNFKNDEYSSLMSNIKPENLQKILEELIVPGSKRTVSKCSGPAYFPFTITIMCLKTKIFANVKKTGYSQCTITDWDLYRIAGDSILQRRVEESEDPEEEEEDPTKIEPLQEAKVLDEAKPMEPEAKPDVKTSMFKTLPDL